MSKRIFLPYLIHDDGSMFPSILAWVNSSCEEFTVLSDEMHTKIIVYCFSRDTIYNCLYKALKRKFYAYNHSLLSNRCDSPSMSVCLNLPEPLLTKEDKRHILSLYLSLKGFP